MRPAEIKDQSSPLLPPARAIQPLRRLRNMEFVVQGPSLSTAHLEELTRLAGATDTRPAGPNAARLTGVTAVDPASAYCREHRLDGTWLEAPLRPSDFRWVCMDMDSTLITIECIDEIADLVGVKPQVAAITEAAMRGELDFPSALRSRVALLEGLEEARLQVGEQVLHREQRAPRDGKPCWSPVDSPFSPSAFAPASDWTSPSPTSSKPARDVSPAGCWATLWMRMPRPGRCARCATPPGATRARPSSWAMGRMISR